MLRLLEHYPSVQGEGPRTGIPTQFVRFAGCNLRCPGWPCDTQFAIQPNLFKREQHFIGVNDMVEACRRMANETGAANICLTGGEPLLQNVGNVTSLVKLVSGDWQFTGIEMFSNGTLAYTDAIIGLCHVIMDWKLPGSGEDPDNETRVVNYKAMADSDMHTIKFTCRDEHDLDVARVIYERYAMASFKGDIYVGPVWNAKLQPHRIVEFILQHQLPWRLNLQIHKFVWAPDARRT